MNATTTLLIQLKLHPSTRETPKKSKKSTKKEAKK